MYLTMISAAIPLLFSAALAAAEPTLQRTPEERIAGRTFPSVFQAWNEADNLKNEDKWSTLARHDLVFHAPDFVGLKWAGKTDGVSTEFVQNSLDNALALRKQLLAKNPNLILLAELRYRDAHSSYLPENHDWWKRENGRLVSGWEEGGYLQLDFANPAYRAHVARQAKAIMDSGVFDGIMLDWWQDDDDRLALVREIRKEIGGKALILANANDRKTPRTAAFVNGYFMECYKSKTAEDWRQIADTLQWAEKNLREPRINCVETWFHKSREDLNLMRATTTLCLTLSDGYCLFSDPNPLPTADHLHDWYKFWDKSLGRPKSRHEQKADGSYQREFDRGTAVYNPLGNKPARVTFAKPHTSASSNQTGTTFVVQPEDGDLFLRETKK